MENADPSSSHRRPNPGKPRQGPGFVLFLSLSLNLALFLFLAVAWQKQTSTPNQGIPQDDQEKSTSGNAHSARFTRRSASSIPWKQFESTDIAVYAANLRAAGCPEKTLRNILLPMVEEKFQPAASEPKNFWASFRPEPAAADSKGREETRRQENDHRLEEMLGFVWTSEGLKQAHAWDATRSLGFLEHDQAEKLLCITDRYRTQLLRAGPSIRTDGLAPIYQTCRNEVAKILSPNELEEFELRQFFIRYARQNPNFIKAGFSASELRQLMTFRRELFNPSDSALVWKSDEPLDEPDWASERQFNTKVRALLGDERFLTYLVAGDISMERTVAAIDRENLPAHLALELFDFRQEALARAQEIRQMPVRRNEKRMHLAALRQNVLEQIAGLSNAEGTENQLVELNRDWLQEIANP